MYQRKAWALLQSFAVMSHETMYKIFWLPPAELQDTAA
jgi:hypothetical protein